jgi:GTP-binding protein HflX
MYETAEPQPRALLMAVRTPDVSEPEFESSLNELERLVGTLGYDVVGRVTQARAALTPSVVLGDGKLKELCELTGGSAATGPRVSKPKDKARLRRAEESDVEADDADRDAEERPPIDLIAVDHDLSPSQLRNLERATGVDVLDRTGIIIQIFHRHAKSRQARLEVEIARLTYEAPRLRESPRGRERQHGRGSGEAALEMDRRRIRDRIAELREEIASIAREESVRRRERRHARRVALVGYTNAGKSSFMRALTGSQVLVENKLFATLDTTVRALAPETRPRILMSDTVGFIKNLPHDLVASFKSTLDEALEASLLLHVVDVSDPDWESQLVVTEDVLEEIGASEVPTLLLMNKVDRVDEQTLADVRRRFPKAEFVSAHRPDDVLAIRARIVEFFEARYVTAELTVPYAQQRLISDMHESGRVLEERYEQDGVVVRLSADPETVARLRAELERAPLP